MKFMIMTYCNPMQMMMLADMQRRARIAELETFMNSAILATNDTAEKQKELAKLKLEEEIASKFSNQHNVTAVDALNAGGLGVGLQVLHDRKAYLQSEDFLKKQLV